MKERAWNIPWALLCAMLTLLQLRLAGYTFGFGNQSLQIPYLQSVIEPMLYAGDPLIRTFEHYPSGFYRALGWLLRHMGGVDAIPGVYLFLHAVAAYLVLYAGSSIMRSLTRCELPALILMLLLLAGHQQGIAESGLYSMGFTHTWFGFGLVLLALAAALSGRFLAGCLIAGIAFNVHALLAAYAIVFLGGATLATWRWRNMAHYLLGALFFVGAASPALAVMLMNGGHGYDQAWGELLRARSSHHVFPSSWWTAGDPQVPRFVVTFAFATVGCSLLAPRSSGRRVFGGVIAAGLALFTCGIICVEAFPVPLVMRAQLFRASQLLMLFMLGGVAIAASAGCAVRRLNSASATHPGSRLLSRALTILGVPLAAATICVYAVPGLESWRLTVLLITALVLVLEGRLLWWAAAAVSAALFVHVVSYIQLGLPLLPLAKPTVTILDFQSHAASMVGYAWFPALLVAATGLLGRVRYVRTGHAPRAWLTGSCWALMVATGWALWPAHVADSLCGPESPWEEVQHAVDALTPADAIVLVPPRQSGFRIHSRRAISGEWRDGTQQFFDPEYAHMWFLNMSALLPGTKTAPGVGMVHPGVPFETHSTQALLSLCEQFGADYLILPTSHPKQLVEAYANDHWRLYEAEARPPPPPPEGVFNTNGWHAQEAFMQEVVLPNIEQHRKRNASIRFASDGEPGSLLGRRYRIVQIDSDFGFGSALELFKERQVPPNGIGNTCVSAPQLERFSELFNYSIIGYSGKWRVIEVEQGKPDFSDLDAYIGWCRTNDVRVQYHFVSGYQPAWVEEATDEQKEQYLLKHTDELIERYGDDIQDWQVVNEKQLLQQSVPAFKRFREKLPGARLGVSDCARFYSDPTRHRHVGGWRRRTKRVPTKVGEMRDLCRGISMIDWLSTKGVDLDFFAFHAHRPFGLWADPRKVYKAFDSFAERGVRIHVSEFGIPVPGKIEGALRRGEWTRELQAEYYARLYTIMFSHPSVDVINLWGMGHTTWMAGAGLVDAEGNPNLSYDTLRELIHETWRTDLSGTIPVDGKIDLRGFHGHYAIYLDDAAVPAETFHLSAATHTPLEVIVTMQPLADAVSSTPVP